MSSRFERCCHPRIYSSIINQQNAYNYILELGYQIGKTTIFTDVLRNSMEKKVFRYGHKGKYLFSCSHLYTHVADVQHVHRSHLSSNSICWCSVRSTTLKISNTSLYTALRAQPWGSLHERLIKYFLCWMLHASDGHPFGVLITLLVLLGPFLAADVRAPSSAVLVGWHHPLFQLRRPLALISTVLTAWTN